MANGFPDGTLFLDTLNPDSPPLTFEQVQAIDPTFQPPPPTDVTAPFPPADSGIDFTTQFPGTSLLEGLPGLDTTGTSIQDLLGLPAIPGGQSGGFFTPANIALALGLGTAGIGLVEIIQRVAQGDAASRQKLTQAFQAATPEQKQAIQNAVQGFQQLQTFALSGGPGIMGALQRRAPGEETAFQQALQGSQSFLNEIFGGPGGGGGRSPFVGGGVGGNPVFPLIPTVQPPLGRLLSGGGTDNLAVAIDPTLQSNPLLTPEQRMSLVGIFAQSPEFLAKTGIGKILSGAGTDNIAASALGNLENPEAAKQFVTELYRNILGREPEPAGLTFWTQRLLQTGNVQDVISGIFTSSEELSQRESATTQIQELYQSVLGREPSPQELNNQLLGLSLSPPLQPAGGGRSPFVGGGVGGGPSPSPGGLGLNQLLRSQGNIFNALGPVAQDLAKGQLNLSPQLQRTVEQVFQPQLGNLVRQLIEAARNQGFAGGAELLNQAPAAALGGPLLSNLQGQMAGAKLDLAQSLPQLSALIGGAFTQPIAARGSLGNLSIQNLAQLGQQGLQNRLNFLTAASQLSQGLLTAGVAGQGSHQIQQGPRPTLLDAFNPLAQLLSGVGLGLSGFSAANRSLSGA